MNGIELLPIYSELDRIAELASGGKILVLTAEPGAGKTTLVPWKLLQSRAFGGKKILLLEPRRIAARTAADRIAFLLDEKTGGRVGLRTRQETIVGKDVRLEVVTEAILTRMIQNDPCLEEYGAVIFDEFHERSIHADLGLALVMESRASVREDLSVIIMSATISPEPIRAAYGDINELSVPGRTFPVEVKYLPPLRDEKMWNGAFRLGCAALKENPAGDVLVFLPGFREISRAKELFDASSCDAEAVILHGSLPPEVTRGIVSGEGTCRRIILSTNVAETSITIPGVRAVVDTGYCRRVRYSPRTGMDHTETVRIPLSSAEQRRGRAGRIAAGVCYRWWSEHEPLERDNPPEIVSADLAPFVMECALWGSSPRAMKFITDPPPASVARAESLLAMLSLIDDNGKITAAGKAAMSTGLHPRLGRMMADAIALGHGSTGALIAALLEEDDIAPGTDADFRDRVSLWLSWNRGGYANIRTDRARRVKDEATRIMRSSECGFDAGSVDPAMAGALLLRAYPDRAAVRSGQAKSAQSRWILAGGRGASIRGAFDEFEFLVAPEIDGGEGTAKILLAAPLSRDLVESGAAGEIVTRREFEWNGWVLRARSIQAVGSLIL
ncbi:MAG TPA: helicase-related protein, partial [Spirochaetota bacterium]|nr:helicase-related protein [Spirochaetota bacterium]